MEYSSSSSSVSTNSDHHYPYLNNLPDLVYYHILKNLDLDDLWNSRLISKRFYSIIKNYHINELNFSYLSYGFDRNWFTTTRSPKHEYQLPSAKLDLLCHPSNNLLNLKYLRMGEIDHKCFRLDNLNKFTKLQILEIEWIRLVSNDLLQLPDLKALDIYLVFHDLEGKLEGGSLVVDTPNLHSLAIQSDIVYNQVLIGNQLKINHPLSIKYLQLDQYGMNAPIFTNLECLEFLDAFNVLEPNNLFEFNSLKFLKINRWDGEDADKLKDLFSSKENDLEFVIDGVRIKEINKIDEYNNSSILEFQLNNYGELEDDLWFGNIVIYGDLVRLLPDYQPADLLTKFTNIRYIHIWSGVEDVTRLIHFIRGCSSLNKLEIKKTSLNQQFYDQLSTIKSLACLEIYEDEDFNLDFKFLIKMPYLRILETDQDVLISSQLNLNNFKRLERFKFKIDDRVICIIKEGKDRFKIRNPSTLGLPDHDYVDHNKLVKWSNQLRCTRQTRSMSRKRKLLSL